MIYHKIYNSWAWTGGHSDGDSDLLYVAMKEAKEETGIKNVTPIFKEIYSLESIGVNGHEKRGKYVSTHVHFNVTYLLEADEKQEIHIKEDENSGVKWVPIDKILETTSEAWVRDRVYTKIIEKMKKDKIITIRVSEKEKKKLIERSEVAKLSLSEYLIKQGLNKEIVIVDGLNEVV